MVMVVLNCNLVIVTLHKTGSLALPDRFFSFILGREKKGLVNGLYHFCSTDPQFLRVVNWPLIATKACILV